MTDRSLRRSDFRRVFERGTYLAGDQLAVRFIPRDEDGPSRFGFVISRRIGGAVVRNRLRRRLKAILQNLSLARGYDLVWVVRNATPMQHDDLVAEVRSLLEKSGALGEAVAK